MSDFITHLYISGGTGRDTGVTRDHQIYWWLPELVFTCTETCSKAPNYMRQSERKLQVNLWFLNLLTHWLLIPPPSCITIIHAEPPLTSLNHIQPCLSKLRTQIHFETFTYLTHLLRSTSGLSSGFVRAQACDHVVQQDNEEPKDFGPAASNTWPVAAGHVKIDD